MTVGDTEKTSDGSVRSVATAAQLPTLVTSSCCTWRTFTATLPPKSTASGNVSAARSPRAWTGTVNFSRSVEHTSSVWYAAISRGVNRTR